MFLNQSACVLEGSLLTYKYNTLTNTWLGLSSACVERNTAEAICDTLNGNLVTLPTKPSAEWLSFELSERYGGNSESIIMACHENSTSFMFHVCFNKYFEMRM